VGRFRAAILVHPVVGGLGRPMAGSRHSPLAHPSRYRSPVIVGRRRQVEIRLAGPRTQWARGWAGHGSRGFTWIELMNFVSLAAIVGALGMYGVGKYVRHAKTAEAVSSVQRMAEAAAAYYNDSDANQPAGTPEADLRAMRHFPPASRASVPSNASDVRGKQYASGMADWAVSPWRELHFSIPQPQCYAYSFNSAGTGDKATATAVAQGDLDGDGVTSTYELSISPDDKLTARVATELKSTNPEE